MRALRYRSPAYKWGDPAEDPRFWARDWWVPLGKLPPGSYSGWVREFAPRAFPTWVGDTVLPLGSPIMVEPYDNTLPISFRVRCVK